MVAAVDTLALIPGESTDGGVAEEETAACTLRRVRTIVRSSSPTTVKREGMKRGPEHGQWVWEETKTWVRPQTRRGRVNP